VKESSLSRGIGNTHSVVTERRSWLQPGGRAHGFRSQASKTGLGSKQAKAAELKAAIWVVKLHRNREMSQWVDLSPRLQGWKRSSRWDALEKLNDTSLLFLEAAHHCRLVHVCMNPCV
jgi:hypothetical protein